MRLGLVLRVRYVGAEGARVGSRARVCVCGECVRDKCVCVSALCVCACVYPVCVCVNVVDTREVRRLSNCKVNTSYFVGHDEYPRRIVGAAWEWRLLVNMTLSVA